MFAAPRAWIRHHKLLSLLITAGLAGGAYYIFRPSTTTAETRYVVGTVERGTIITSVSGSGQVSASNQIDVNPKVSGDILTVLVQSGQAVKAGDILATLDSRTAKKAVRDASINLASAQIALKKLKEPATDLTLLQAQNSLSQANRDYENLIKPPDTLTILQAQNAISAARDAKTKSTNDLAKAYDDGFTEVTKVFSDIPTVVTGIFDGLYGYNMTPTQQNVDFFRDTLALYNDRASEYRLDVINHYQTTKNSYDSALANFKTIGRLSSTSSVEMLIKNSASTVKQIGETIKNFTTFIRLYQESLTIRGIKVETYSTTELSTLDSYSTLVSTHIASLTTILNTIQSQKDSLVSTDRTIAEKTVSLQELIDGPDLDKRTALQEKITEAQENVRKLTAGADALDLKTQELSVAARANTLIDAQETLADYTVRAPIAGTIAKVNAVKGGNASPSTALATIIGKQRLATIPLNEVDVAKISLTQKTTLTFDALPDLSITGQVVEIDTLGTVSQGVVTYNVKIGFDTEDDRIKPGMSVTAAIITNVKQNVVTVTSGAIKTRGTESYVQIPDPSETTTSSSQGLPLAKPLNEKIIEVGLNNGAATEIVSGLNEGETIIVRTISTAPKTTSQTSAASLLTGGNRAAGGAAGATRAFSR